MVSTNSVKNKTRARDAADWTKSSNTDKKYKSFLLGLLKDTDHVIGDPELDSCQAKIHACESDQGSHERESGQCVTYFLSYCVICRLCCLKKHFFSPYLTKVVFFEMLRILNICLASGAIICI